jgi:hypothetical protein
MAGVRSALCAAFGFGLARAASNTASTIAARQQLLVESWAHELDAESKQTPVQRVVSLLEKMKGELEAEAAKESEMYDTMVCWCETNEKEKTKAIGDAEVRTNDLTAEITERAAQFGEGGTEIIALKEQIVKDKAALAQATALREKEAAAFNEEEKADMQAVTNLKNAVEVLSKHHGGAASLVQADSEVVASVRAVLRDVSLRYELMQGDLPAGSTKGAAFLQANADTDNKVDLAGALRASLGAGKSSMPVSIAQHALAQQAAHVRTAFVQAAAAGPESYSSQSGGIFGILKQMKDEFEADLSQKQKDEMKAVTDFKAMAASKSAQISAGEKKLDSMEGNHADNVKALSDAKEDLTATRDQRTEDVEFLRNLRLTCQDLDAQWAARSHTRSAEITAVAEALAVLKEDDARELTAKTVTLLQVDADTSMKMRRNRAVASLRAAATMHKRALSPDDDGNDLLAAWQGMRAADAGGPHAQLSTLAVSVELDSFAEVKKAMDKMMADLKDQQQEEVDQKAFCTTELNENEKNIFHKDDERQDLEAKISTLQAAIQALQDQMAAAKTQIEETQLAMAKASQAREEENGEFQTVVADQRATQEILQKALTRLEAFYKKNLGADQLAGFVQQDQTPPVQFNDYKKSGGGNSVMGLIEQIIEDSKALEKEAMDGEQKAQVDYEDFVKSSNKVVADLQAAIQTKTKAVAAAQLELEQAQSDHGNALGELEALAAYKADLHTNCDFLLKNFDVRQKARQQEIEAIQEGKAILSGMA